MSLSVLTLAIFLYFVVYTLVSFALIGYSLFETALQKAERGDRFKPQRGGLSPGVTIVAPAYNESVVVVTSVRSLLACDYAPLEVVVVDDGSTDDTVDRLNAAFQLVELPVGDRFRIETAPVERIYVSRADPRLRVIRKENGGRSDALNAGINIARHELVAMIDCDSLLEPDALTRIAEVFAANPDRVLAVGGTIRIANGAVIEDGRVVAPQVPVRGTPASQVGEYLRGFAATRTAWARMNGLLIISGAFGVFRRDVLRELGGLSSATLGEDMELVLRLHERMRPTQPGARVEYAADATCWTEAPSGLKALRGQRIRWHVGLLDNLWLHRRLLGRRRFGAVGLASVPYSILFEALAPLLQFGGYLLTIVLFVFDEISWQAALALFLIVLLVGQTQTAGAILIEEVGFRRYRNRDLMLIAGWALLDIFWFRPLVAWWCVKATVLTLVNRRPGWGEIPRGGALGAPVTEEAPELAPAPLPR